MLFYNLADEYHQPRQTVQIAFKFNENCLLIKTLPHLDDFTCSTMCFCSKDREIIRTPQTLLIPNIQNKIEVQLMKNSSRIRSSYEGNNHHRFGRSVLNTRKTNSDILISSGDGS